MYTFAAEARNGQDTRVSTVDDFAVRLVGGRQAQELHGGMRQSTISIKTGWVVVVVVSVRDIEEAYYIMF
jgi:uncharacterized protein (DUF2252 family)